MTDTDSTEGKGGEAVRGSHDYEHAALAMLRRADDFSAALAAEAQVTLIAPEAWTRTQQDIARDVAVAQVYATLAAAEETRRLANIQEAALLLSQLDNEQHVLEDEEVLPFTDSRHNQLNEHRRWRNAIRADARKLLGR